MRAIAMAILTVGMIYNFTKVGGEGAKNRVYIGAALTLILIACGL